MSHWTTRRLLTSLADLLQNEIATTHRDYTIRLNLSRTFAERIAAAAQAAADCSEMILDEVPPDADNWENALP